MILRLLSLVNQLLLVGFFILFSFGLLACTRRWTRSASSLGERRSALGLSRNSGLELLTGVIAFCLFCNLLLILPGILELASISNKSVINGLHQTCLAIITFAAWVVAFFGAWSLLKRHRRSERTLWRSIPAMDDLSIRVLLLVPSIYLVVAPFIKLNYDTALYHYPSILHFLAFGPELGVANFHFSFGFYNLQQFGQVALQNLSESRFFLSPTLNLIFVEAFLLTLATSFVASENQRERASAQHSNRTLGTICFLVVSLLFAIDGGSLVSFDADLAVTSITLSLVFILYFHGHSEQRCHALYLACFLPLLKTSGIVGLLLIVLMELVRKALPEDANTSWKFFLASMQSDIRNLGAKRPVLLLIALSYLLMLITNIITSGYLLFPVPSTGPIGSHAVPGPSVRMIKSALVTNYARFNNDGAMSKTFGDRSIAYSDWLPQFLRSEWGQLIGFWLLSALVIALVVASLKVLRRQDLRLHRLFALSMPMVVITVLALFILPPNPRFFPWIGALIGFEFTELMLLYPLIAISSLASLMSVLSLRLQRPMVRAFGNDPFTTRNLTQEQLYGWKSRAERQKTSDSVEVRSPLKDKCYAIEPPCTPYIPSATGMVDK